MPQLNIKGIVIQVHSTLFNVLHPGFNKYKFMENIEDVICEALK